MTIYSTKNTSTNLWNQNGNKHGKSPFVGSQIDLTDNVRPVPVVGTCRGVIAIAGAFVSVNDITAAAPPPPPPPPPPAPQPKHVIEVYVDGVLEYRKELYD